MVFLEFFFFDGFFIFVLPFDVFIFRGLMVHVAQKKKKLRSFIRSGDLFSSKEINGNNMCMLIQELALVGCL